MSGAARFWMTSLLAATVLFMTVRVAEAHPHVWIDMETRLAFDEEGRARSLRIVWTFDEFYSLYALNKPADEATRAEMLSLVNDYVAGLESFGYFARVTADGERVSFNGVVDRDARADGEKLIMIYELGLAEPVDPRSQALRYAVFDPTYFIEIRHLEDAGAAALGDKAPESCRTDIEPPDPDPDVVNLAAALGPTESAGEEIGVLFAEWVRVEC